jgi:hypothetical protein
MTANVVVGPVRGDRNDRLVDQIAEFTRHAAQPHRRRGRIAEDLHPFAQHEDRVRAP